MGLIYTRLQILEHNLTSKSEQFNRDAPDFINSESYQLINYLPDLFYMYYNFPEPAAFSFLSDATEEDIEAFGQYPHYDDYGREVTIYSVVDKLIE